MERERGSKAIAIVALCVGVVGLSLGFAAFASQLTIKPSASVSPNKSSFNVDFSTTEITSEGQTAVAGSVTGTAIGAATAGTASIDNSGDDSVIKDLSAKFTKPGESVTYKFYAYNAGEYEAFLNSVTFANATNGTTHRVCTPGTGTTASMVAAACENISLTVKVGDDSYTGSTATVDTHSLAVGTSEPVEVTIEYTGDKLVDGDFSVAFGDITLKYESVD